MNKNVKNNKEVPLVVDKLKDDLIWAYYDLDEYLIIFGENKLQKELIAETALHFFINLKRYYWDRFTVTISRMTENENTGTNKNLTVKSLRSVYEEYKLDIDYIDKKIELIEEKRKLFKKRRDKYIVHRDYKFTTDPKLLNENKIVLEDIIDIYKVIGELLNNFFGKILNEQYSWHMIKANASEEMLYYLLEGIRYTEIKEKRKDWRKDLEEENNSKYKKITLNSQNTIDKYYGK